MVEIDRRACETIRANTNWALSECDVRAFDFARAGPGVDLLAAGVPCQPWSIGGKHRGFEDRRNLFPDTIRAVVALRPKAILIENVRGLTRESFSSYFTYVQWMLRYPELDRRAGEDWPDHRARLEKLAAADGKGYRGLRYDVWPRLVNAADYGVPQKRERVFLVAFRSDLGTGWEFPPATHSREALLRSQWVDGGYWDWHRVPPRYRPPKPPGIERLGAVRGSPWRTVRDALAGLPDPESAAARSIPNHVFQPGARVYTGHTGSPLDGPAKTLKAGDHGVPGGENMIAYPEGRVRYFTVREAATMQTFPADFVFPGCWSENMRQIGNAVPVELARVVAAAIAERLAPL